MGTRSSGASLRNGWGSYAFGDYYEARYARVGYQAWATYGPRCRDSLFGYYRWHNRTNVNWQRTLVATSACCGGPPGGGKSAC